MHRHCLRAFAACAAPRVAGRVAYRLVRRRSAAGSFASSGPLPGPARPKCRGSRRAPPTAHTRGPRRAPPARSGFNLIIRALSVRFPSRPASRPAIRIPGLGSHVGAAGTPCRPRPARAGGRAAALHGGVLRRRKRPGHRPPRRSRGSNTTAILHCTAATVPLNTTPARVPLRNLEAVIEPHATMQHSRVSRAALRAGPATVARNCGPAGPSRGLGPAWADHDVTHESSCRPGGPRRVTFRRTNQMCSTNSLRLRRRHRRLPGIHRRRHLDRRAATLRGGGPVSGPVAGRA